MDRRFVKINVMDAKFDPKVVMVSIPIQKLVEGTN